MSNFEGGLDLLDGKLSLDPFTGIGEKGATLDGSLVFTPVPGGYELRAQLLALIQTPATSLVRLLGTPGGQIARVVDARREKIPETD
jgi:hypothetical protein